jgi:hypothetical protein
MTDTTVPIPVPKRADKLVVRDRILPAFLPSPFFKEPGEVVFVKVHDYRKGRYVFVAYMQDNGFYDSTSYEPDGEVEVFPAPADSGLGYSRADDGETTQAIGVREPLHTGAMTEGGLVDETEAKPMPGPIHLDFADGRSFCGLAAVTPHKGSLVWREVTCPDCQSAGA